MNLPPKRTILGIISASVFLVSSLFLYIIPHYYKIAPSVYIHLSDILIVTFNIPIILTWISFGPVAAAFVTLISAAFILLLLLRIGLYAHRALEITFIFTSIFGFLFWRRKNAISEIYQLKMEKVGEDINILTNLAGEKRKTILSVEDKLRRYAQLKEVIDSLSAHIMVDETMNLIMEKAVKTLGKPGRALLFLVNTDKQELMLFASKGAARVEAKKGDIFDKWVLKNRKSLIIEDVVTDFRFSPDEIVESKKVFRSIIATPLVSQDKIVGILRVDSPREMMFTQDDLRLLDIIADLGAVSIENAFLYAKTQDLAIKDSLTGLAVRRYFMERLQEEIKRTALKKGRFSVLMLDIDHFKNYNDQFGHAAGDIVLKHLARTMRSMVREGDIVARYGGEEIVALLCGSNKKESVLEAEDMRKVIKDSPIVLRRHTANVTVSIGIAVYPEDGLTAEALIKTADARLYKAKSGGRNRVSSS